MYFCIFHWIKYWSSGHHVLIFCTLFWFTNQLKWNNETNGTVELTSMGSKSQEQLLCHMTVMWESTRRTDIQNLSMRWWCILKMFLFFFHPYAKLRGNRGATCSDAWLKTICWWGGSGSKNMNVEKPQQQKKKKINACLLYILSLPAAAK